VGQWCCSGVTVVLQWCYSSVTVVLQWRHSGDALVLQRCYYGVHVCRRCIMMLVTPIRHLSPLPCKCPSNPSQSMVDATWRTSRMLSTVFTFCHRFRRHTRLMELTHGVAPLQHQCHTTVIPLRHYCNTTVTVTPLQTVYTHGVVFSARRFACKHRNSPLCYARREQQRYLFAVFIKHERLKLIAIFVEQVHMKLSAIFVERERITLKHDMLSLMS
jgi:hypothetical protein